MSNAFPVALHFIQVKRDFPYRNHVGFDVEQEHDAVDVYGSVRRQFLRVISHTKIRHACDRIVDQKYVIRQHATTLVNLQVTHYSIAVVSRYAFVTWTFACIYDCAVEKSVLRAFICIDE